ncbi:MAG: AbrB/MazE/SpoVT family DNA-binding domain-containing protein [Limnochordales bacterium]|nr:AbrB/MazE/SpoVT family DNA-binding domain-containing protein [Limnochordales bacterium]
MNMKETGVVRRMDELGRIVIPKEIRRTLRIREGDPLEIFIDRGNEVILKRYAPITAVEDHAQEYVEALHDSLGFIAIVADTQEVVGVAGAPKKQLLGRAVNEDELAKIAQAEDVIVSHTAGQPPLIEGFEPESQVIAPIRRDGELEGVVIVASRDPKHPVGELEQAVVRTAADFLARQLR